MAHIDSIPEQQKQRIVQELQKRGANRPCPRCGNMTFTLLDGYFNQSLTGTVSATIVIGGPTIPSIVTACTQCGFLSQHALGALGLLREEAQNE
jgi:hypothetical protein